MDEYFDEQDCKMAGALVQRLLQAYRAETGAAGVGQGGAVQDGTHSSCRLWRRGDAKSVVLRAAAPFALAEQCHTSRALLRRRV